MSPEELARLNNIPNELKELNQWCLWREIIKENGRPTKVPYQPNGQKASVTDVRTYSSYNECLSVIDQYEGLGFIFTINDPYCFLDLDNCGNSQQAIDKQIEIYNQFESYSEISPSGKGLHIICKASIAKGFRLKEYALEVYPHSRYATMTGRIWGDYSIRYCQNEVEILEPKETKNVNVTYETNNVEESDECIITKARAAKNGDKFISLYTGHWQALYPSQSEGDFALIDIIAFFTRRDTQVARIFRGSLLGARSKAKRNDYVYRMIKRARDHQLPDIDIVGNAAAIDKLNGHKAAHLVELVISTIDRPPGFVGEIADYLYFSAPTPVLEIAYASSLTAMAGLCGRAYNVLGNGLNLNAVCVAQSGIGKEWAKVGIERLISELKNYCKSNGELLIDADSFIGPRRFASLSALNDTLIKQKSFVSTMDEFGLKLQLMLSTDKSQNYQNELCAALLEVYGASGRDSIFRPAVFADRTKNTGIIKSPCVVILGLTTPSTFYPIINEDTIAQGFLSRFSVIEYLGLAVPLNKNRKLADPQLLIALKRLIENCHKINFNIDNGDGKPVDIVLDNAAEKISDDFYEYARDLVNNAGNEAFKQLWSRAHMKALKIAALYSIDYINYDSPIILPTHLDLAIRRVKFDIETLSAKFEKSEVGSVSSENKQYNDMIKNIIEYINHPWEKSKGYCRDCEKLHPDKIVSYEFLHNRTGRLTSMKKDRMGTRFALDRTIKILVDNGKLVEVVDKTKYGLLNKKIYQIRTQLFE